jgi:hypothetical protein
MLSGPIDPPRRPGFDIAAFVAVALGAASLGAAADLTFDSEPTAVRALTLVRLDASPLDVPDSVVLSTNACVDALSKSDLLQAKTPCSAAVHAARTAFLNTLATYDGEHLRHDLAVAYSNRAVMHVLSGDVEPAKQDIARACALLPGERWLLSTRATIDATATRPAGVLAQAAL